jgi:hypothetical protein
MTDLERIELALHRTQARFQKNTDVGLFIEYFLNEIQRQNQIVFNQEHRPKVVE